MTIIDDRLPWLDTINLSYGPHNDPNEGVCAMEAVAYIAGEPHTDRPDCASPVLAAFVRTWNDALPDEARDRLLKPLIPRLVGTRGDDATEERRAWMATDWLVRFNTPAWLRLAGLDEQAARLEALPELTGADVAPTIKPTLDAVREDAAAAWTAAAGDAAWVAARVAAGAAGDAARDAAWVAAGAAGDAARAARVAARAAAMDAARVAAGDAAWLAVMTVPAGPDAAGAAARDALQPTVDRLQASAVELIERMIAA